MNRTARVLILTAFSCALACTQLTSIISGSSADTPVPVNTPLSPSTPQPPTEQPRAARESWPAYTNQDYSFQLSYPSAGQIDEQYDIYARILLPFIPDVTTLVEKYLEVNVAADLDPCESNEYSVDASQNQTLQIGGLNWLKETGGDAGAGQFHDITAFSASKGNLCVTLKFVLHSTNALNYDPPRKEFDVEFEKAVYTDIVSSFRWLDS